MLCRYCCFGLKILTCIFTDDIIGIVNYSEGDKVKYIKQAGIIFVISFIGELLHYFIPLPVPASIYGLVLMLVLLVSGVLKTESVRETSSFLIEIMPLMFIPAATGIMNSWDIIRPQLIPYILLIVVSLVTVMAVSGLVTQTVIRRGRIK